MFHGRAQEQAAALHRREQWARPGRCGQSGAAAGAGPCASGIPGGRPGRAAARETSASCRRQQPALCSWVSTTRESNLLPSARVWYLSNPNPKPDLSMGDRRYWISLISNIRAAANPRIREHRRTVKSPCEHLRPIGKILNQLQNKDNLGKEEKKTTLTPHHKSDHLPGGFPMQT